MKTRVRARIHGRVQGVGFRPTVYRYATHLGLAGYVCNGPHGVTLEVEGEDLNVGLFFTRLTGAPPPQASIENIEKQVLGTKGYERFEVIESEPDGELAMHITPDLALCDDCARELRDPRNRRYGYAFTNCTNCGPRFTIIRDLPYDRANTSMAGFAMCPPCDHEYHNPHDRRFHAQPDACPKCGPQLQLMVTGGTSELSQPLQKTEELLRRGRIVAIKSLGGFHLACDALSREAVARLRHRKQRPHKSFAVMFRDLVAVRKYCQVNEAEEAELLSSAHPIVVLKSKSPALQPTIAPDSNTIGAFLPYTPLHWLLLEKFDALVMTSANLAEEPIASEDSELPAVFDAVLTHNRPIVHKCDDSVVRVINGQRQFFRRARGFAPNAIRFAPDSAAILAVGGELKNTFCLARAGNAFLSQHIGDLKDFKTYNHFAAEIAEWRRLMRVEPTVVAHDLHPAYLSTRFAKEFVASTKIGVQHHHAHIASVMAEHDLHDFVIGVALDGTGSGTDGTVWGGEVLVANRADFERVAHFKQYALPGGDKAVEEPWRMATSMLAAEELIQPNRRTEPIFKMIEAQFNSPLTSSAGRLFDAVAAILGLGDVVSYEAQAAIRLEAVADATVEAKYPFEIAFHQQPWILNFGAMLRQIMTDKRAGVPVSEISAKFHNTIAGAIVQTCRFIRGQRNLNTVALSGGVFQNELLLRRLVESLQRNYFKVYTNTRVPPNDGGLALGQAAVAAARTAACA
ncbi:MAG: Carbamoyltransferase HypF [Verrucomicrobiae bacterium]|nr:Carbamoyltransferase HypF [Verrucomicrobiae bacterium]